MLILNEFGWIDGITASGVVIFGFIFGFFFLFKARKSGAKILTILGFVNILAGLMYLGVFTDFLVVLATETNLDPYFLVGILSYIWFAPVMILALYIGAELLIPKKKWYLLFIIVVLCILFEILFFLNPLTTFNFVLPPVGEALIDYNVNMFTPAGILMALLLFMVLVILGFGFLIKSIQSSGVLRKKFLFLSLGAISFCIFGLLEGLTEPGLMVIFVRLGFLISFWLMYYGLKD